MLRKNVAVYAQSVEGGGHLHNYHHWSTCVRSETPIRALEIGMGETMGNLALT